MRRKTRIDDKIEELSVVESINTLRRAQVVALVVDATQPLENQDLSIANLAIQEGKAMLLVVNKCDLIKDRKAFVNELEYQVEKTMTDIKGIPIILISATENYNIQAIFKEALRVEKSWRKEISTGVLNNWLMRETERHIPPIASNGRRIRLKYIVQSATKPPTFTIFCNIPDKLPQSYSRYLDQSLRDNFGFFGVPIRIKYRKNANPYLNN
jgi:GTP-binding protein